MVSVGDEIEVLLNQEWRVATVIETVEGECQYIFAVTNDDKLYKTFRPCDEEGTTWRKI